MIRVKKEFQCRGITTAEDMCNAVNSVIVDGLSIREVARRTGIKRITLGRYVLKKRQNKSDVDIRYTPQYDVRKIFPHEMEIRLADYLQKCNSMNFGLDTITVRKIAYQFAEKNNVTMSEPWNNEKMAGREWLRTFNQRQDLKLRKRETSNLSKTRSFNPENVNKFFDILEKILDDHPTINESKGKRIFNIDETATPKRVIIGTNSRRKSESEVMITTCCIISADGTFLPPAIIFPRKQFNLKMIVGAPSETLGLVTDNGWMTAEVFCQLLDHFINHTNSSKENPTLLICDNHEIHVSLEIIDKAMENGVVLLYLPPHCNQKMQPLDVGVYPNFKAAYNRACDMWAFDNSESTMSIYDVSPLISEAFNESMTPTNIKAGFKNSGIYPFNRNIFTEEDFAESLVMDGFLTPELSSTQNSTPNSRKRKKLPSQDSTSQVDVELPANFALKFTSEMKVVDVIIDHQLETIEKEKLANKKNRLIAKLHEALVDLQTSKANVMKIYNQLKSNERSISKVSPKKSRAKKTK